jgi:hypothetical protein
MRSILLVDDNEALLNALAAALTAKLPPNEAEIRMWVPKKDEEDPKAAFERRIDADTTLVVTDYDLTSQGQTGLFGSSVVAWCQTRAIPVGDFSRANNGALPKEPDLFELRIPTDVQEAANFVAGVFRGFRAIGEALKARPELLTKKSHAVVLGEVLGVPQAENQFALYGVRFGTTSGALMDTIARTAPAESEPPAGEKIALLSYILGHVLLNAVLRFPGPLLSGRALCAYVASDEADAQDVRNLFESAAYVGPFAELEPFFWLWKVDEVLDELAKSLPSGYEAETSGELQRKVLETKLGRTLRRHSCYRCQGKNGGFYCPFTKRTVCQRTDCSVGSNSWIPQGAKLCRIERDFFDKWAPILGL